MVWGHGVGLRDSKGQRDWKCSLMSCLARYLMLYACSWCHCKVSAVALRMYLGMYVRLYVRMYVRMYVCMYVCTYVCIFRNITSRIYWLGLWLSGIVTHVNFSSIIHTYTHIYDVHADVATQNKVCTGHDVQQMWTQSFYQHDQPQYMYCYYVDCDTSTCRSFFILVVVVGEA